MFQHQTSFNRLHWHSFSINQLFLYGFTDEDVFDLSSFRDTHFTLIVIFLLRERKWHAKLATSRHVCEWRLQGHTTMMTSSNGNIFRVTGPLCGEFTGPGEFPIQRPVMRSFNVSLICVWINGWVNNREAGDLRRYRAHYDASVMTATQWPLPQCLSRPSGKLNSWPIVPDDRGFFSVTGKRVYHAASISCGFLYIFRLKFWCAISYKFTGFYENETLSQSIFECWNWNGINKDYSCDVTLMMLWDFILMFSNLEN